MSYEQLQGVTQLIGGCLFLLVLIGVGIHAFRPSNAERFKRLAGLALENEDLKNRK
jgi:cbb3-type cytochrome oxidase subunit 3